MRRPAASLVLLLALCGAALAQGGTRAPGEHLVIQGIPPVPVQLVEDARRYGEFRAAVLSGWHPTRREMLIETRFGETPQIHWVKAPGGARTQVTFSAERASDGTFEPRGGSYVLFRESAGGDEQYQHYRQDLATGAVIRVTEGKSRNGPALWSHAGDQVVYSSTRRNGTDTDLYVMDPAEPKSARLLTEVNGGGWAPLAWSRDDRQLLVREYLSINESYLWLVDGADGKKTLLTPKDGEPVAYRSAQFSADGRQIYLTSDAGSEFQHLRVLDRETGTIKPLTPHIMWDVSEFELSPDGKRIACVINENGVGKLRLLEAKSGRERRLPDLPQGSLSGVLWHANSRDLGFNVTSVHSPSDVYSLDVQSGRVDRWTHGETGGLNLEKLAQPELVQWKSFDGRSISGFLYRPPAHFTGRRPVVIDIHGGPESQARPGFLGRKNYYVNELGAALLFPNIRGSSGYGKTFLKLDNGAQREGAYRDLEALLDWIPSRPGLDPERIMVTGGSYGGHMTLIAATRYSDRIRCALSSVGMSHLESFLKNTSGYRRDLRRAEYGDERDPNTRAFMERTAPLRNAGHIRKPLFLVQGLNDPRVPASEAEQMLAAVRKNNTPAWYLLAKDEGHGFSKKSNADYQFYATVLFMREHLLR